jgi:hypothetical protein
MFVNLIQNIPECYDVRMFQKNFLYLCGLWRIGSRVDGRQGDQIRRIFATWTVVYIA